MPELPEVEAVKDVLNQQLKGLIIKEVDVRYEPMIKNMSADAFISLLTNKTIESLSRRGKYLIFHLNEGYLVSHLRMEGKYFYTDLDFELNPHIHSIFKLDNEKQLLYQDVRKFGTFHYYENEEALKDAAPFQVLGVEPFSSEFNFEYVSQKLKNKKKPIKTLLLDQSVVAGLGNIYVDEVLFLAKINPQKSSQQLTDEEIKNVIKYTKEVLQKAVALKGTTIRSYTSALGVVGGYQNELLVHMKKDEPCVNCQTPIAKIKVGGRGTYYCPVCQPDVLEG
ncbi:MAG TPA: DNA-formamidopyrimidine glycosylase [Firmicutes bacterium]|nr:DNA-formamidopyrimidine glycosylase [Bacillota bacterium]